MYERHRFPKAIILQAVYFKLRFTLSYRDVEELLRIRGVKVDHSTLQRWVFKFSPLIEANMHKRNLTDSRLSFSLKIIQAVVKY